MIDNNTSYNLEEIAEKHEAENFVGTEDNTAFTLAASLYTASEMVGHNNKELRKAVKIAQQLVGDTTDIELKPFDVDSSAYDEGTTYLEKVKQASKVSLAQSKMMKSDEATKYRDIDRLINNVGLAESYKDMRF